MNLEDNENLRTIIEAAPIGICILDAATLKAELLNDKFLEIAGKPRENILGKWYWEPFAEARAYYENALSAVVKTGQPYYADEVELMLIRHGKEEWIYVTFVYAPVKNSLGEITKIAVWVLENTKQVTERQKIENARIAIKLERDRLRDFFMQAPAGICILSGENLIYELVNPGYQALLPGRDLINRPIFEALPELVGTPLEEVLKNVFRTGEAYEVKKLLIPVSKYEGGPTENRYFTFNYIARKGADDEIDGILAFIQEVTEAVNYQNYQAALNDKLSASNEESVAANQELTAKINQLSLNEHFLNRFIMEAPAGLALMRGPDYIYTIYNAAYQAILPGRNLTGRGFFDAVAELKGTPLEEVLYDVYHNGVPHSFSESLVALSDYEGGPTVDRYFTFNYLPWVDDNGKVDGILNLAVEVTEAVTGKQEISNLNDALQTANTQLETATTAARIGTWQIEPSSKELKYNNVLADIFGYEGQAPMTYEQAIGQVLPEFREKLVEQINFAIDNGGYYNELYQQARFNDGQIIWLRSTGQIAKDEFSGGLAFSGVVQDVSQQQEEELRKNSFIGMVSHELKTPLTSLNAILQVADAKLKNSNDGFLSGAMQKANVQVKRMTAMINGFLNVSRLESAKILIEKAPFQLEALVAEVVDETNLTVGSHHIDFDPCPPVTINADRDKISSVISNLIGNAIKYSPNGTAIKVSCELLGGNAVVSIRDFGMGIALEDAQKIFDRYYRVQSNHSKHISGFGIGLYLSAEIIQRHEGKIGVESEIGKGSTFHFSLPLTGPAAND